MCNKSVEMHLKLHVVPEFCRLLQLDLELGERDGLGRDGCVLQFASPQFSVDASERGWLHLDNITSFKRRKPLRKVREGIGLALPDMNGKFTVTFPLHSNTVPSCTHSVS